MSISDRLRLIAIAALLVAAMLVSACDSSSTPTPGTSGTSSNSTTANTASGVANTPTTANAASTGSTEIASNTPIASGSSSDGAVKVAGIDSIKSYHLLLNTKTSAAGTDTVATVEGDFIRPDKAKMTVTASGAKINYVVIGSDSYISMDGQNYTKSSGGQSIADSYTSLLTSSTQSVASFNGMKNVGSESIGGEDCTHYSYQGETSGASAKVELWVAKSDNTVRQWQSTGSTNGMNSEVSFTISNVNKVSDITAPLFRTY